MKKILFLIHTLGGGGAEKVLVDLVNNIDASQYDVTVMTVVDTGIYRSRLAKHIKYKTMLKIGKAASKDTSGSLLANISTSKKKAIGLYTAFWRNFPTSLIYKLFIKEKYDYEVAFLEGICAKIIAASTNPNSKKIAWIHVDLVNQHKSSAVFKNEVQEKLTYAAFDKIMCVSNYAKEQFQKLFDLPRDKLLVRYNAVDDKKIIELSQNEPLKSIITKRKFTICSVGRLNKQKSYIRLLEVAKKLKANFDFDIWIFGEGTDRTNLEEYIKENSLQDCVFLLGYNENPYYYIKQADVFVCSSIAEGFSTAVTEAIILGIPVVTTDCSGMKELLGESEYGLIVENSTQGLFDGINSVLLDDYKLLKFYKEQVMKRRKDFSFDNRVKEIEKIFS